MSWFRRAPLPFDPFTDKLVQQELRELVLAQGASERAEGHLHGVLRASHHAERASLKGCALCGVPFSGQERLEVRPEGFSLIPGERAASARSPYLCRNCIRSDYGSAHAAFQGALSALAGRDNEPMRPGGRPRKELCEALRVLVADSVPHWDERAPCSHCASRKGSFAGAEISLCGACLAGAGAAYDAFYQALADAEKQRLRAEYAKLYVRAEARLVEQGKRTGHTPEWAVVLPPKSTISDWPYTDSHFPERAATLPQSEIDKVGTQLAAATEAHVIAALEHALTPGSASRFTTEGMSGLPMYVERYMEKCRPDEPVQQRLDMAIASMSELLRAGYRFTHQVEDYEWRDATGYFETFHALAGKT